ncbi:MAG: [FeFe] hydrogenase H-cluster maturation GTPase HydF [Ruminococcaceae bacterium]|nr:[FeFe] hydrogenase H-cluster maturation GTPase HydF [Oscillospiraceae bacterium]
MEKTPLSLRKHIAVFGKTNAGKSTLFNALLGQDVSIVSDVSGTTTDPVTKAMELIPYGPIALIDTAGLGDETELGEAREKKTMEILSRVDLVLYVKDISDKGQKEIDFGKTPKITVYTKCDLTDKNTVENVRKSDKDSIILTGYDNHALSELKERMVSVLKAMEQETETLLGNIVPEGGIVVLVIPIDTAAPKGRLILPQVQTIRDCLDYNIRTVATTVEMLEKTLSELNNIDLVVTDSQVFHKVDGIVPSNIPLTSFSMLLANQKGKITQLIKGTEIVSSLEDEDEILMLEACTHNTTHDDIGKVKIPALLQKKTGKNLRFTHLSGHDFPDDIEKYKLVIQCGGCMINKKAIQNRLKIFEEKGIPATNYGVILAYLNGILERAADVFKNK